jgi:hypothetical protein
MTDVRFCSDRAEDLIERFAIARKRLTERPGRKAESVELIAAHNALVEYIAGLEATVAALGGGA